MSIVEYVAVFAMMLGCLAVWVWGVEVMAEWRREKSRLKGDREDIGGGGR